MSLLYLFPVDQVRVPPPQFSLEMPRRLVRAFELLDEPEHKMVSEKVRRQLGKVFEQRRQFTKEQILDSLKSRIKRQQKRVERVAQTQDTTDLHFERFMRKLISVQQDAQQSDARDEE